MSISAEALKLHNESLVMDIHCHPSLKSYLFDRKFKQEFPPDHPVKSKGFDPFTTQVTLPKMKKGGVDAIFSSVYLPENGFEKYCNLIPFVEPVLDLFFPEVIRGVENTDTPETPYLQTLQILDKFENQIEELIVQGEKITIPKSYSEFNDAVDDGNIVVLHSIEGAHSLGRHYDNLDDYLIRLQNFFSRGVCLMTLGHFFRNNIVESTQGLPPIVIQGLFFNYDFNDDEGLSYVGQEVVKKMLDIGMIVDLVHSNKTARDQIFVINNSRGSSKRPLVFSHTGIQHFYNKQLNVSDEEILKIKDCNGTIGIIFNNYWLTGIEDSIFEYEAGIKHIVRTIKHIELVTESLIIYPLELTWTVLQIHVMTLLITLIFPA
ncbi:MAG: membrane dipeptidase [Ignavibacteria bacterium]|nr:membrane dipeptidase [Ignavibacteria bacterium]